jgi:hypothetical protein
MTPTECGRWMLEVLRTHTKAIATVGDPAGIRTAFRVTERTVELIRVSVACCVHDTAAQYVWCVACCVHDTAAQNVWCQSHAVYTIQPHSTCGVSHAAFTIQPHSTCGVSRARYSRTARVDFTQLTVRAMPELISEDKTWMPRQYVLM